MTSYSSDTVSVNMIIEHLSDCRVLSAPNTKTRRFAHVSPLWRFWDDSPASDVFGAGDPAGSDGPDNPIDAENPTDLEPSEKPASPAHPASQDALGTRSQPNMLFCGPTHLAGAFLEQHPGAFILCIQKDAGIPPFVENAKEQVILLQASSDADVVARKLYRLFIAIGSWAASLKEALLDGGGYQELLDLSEPILKNFITVSNAEFELVAHTKNIPIADPAAQHLVEHGINEPETIKFLRRYTAKSWNFRTGIERNPKSALARYEILDYIYRIQGSYFIHVNMHCNNTPPTPALIDTFQLLIDHMSRCVQDDWEKRAADKQEPSALFGELINRTIQDERTLQRRLKEAQLPARGSFTLAMLQFSEKQSEGMMVPYYAHQLQRQLPRFAVGISDYCVLLLAIDQPIDTEVENILRKFAQSYPCTIGISNGFDYMLDFENAFQESGEAIALATRRHLSVADFYAAESSAPIFHFRSFFPTHVVNTATEHSPLISEYVRNSTVSRIAAYDAAHGTSDLKTLYVFLICERKVSSACSLLNMHRNTLLYRIDKIQERFDIDLDDPNTRLHILFELLIHPAM